MFFYLEGSYPKGSIITGLDAAKTAPGAHVYHAGTAVNEVIYMICMSSTATAMRYSLHRGHCILTDSLKY
jgi:hypothetical protein